MSLERLGGSVTGQGKVSNSRVFDDQNQKLLHEILIELKLMNHKLTVISDFDIKEVDLNIKN